MQMRAPTSILFLSMRSEMVPQSPSKTMRPTAWAVAMKLQSTMSMPRDLM